MHALIIEDEPLIAFLIEQELLEMGYSCAIAGSEAEAVLSAEEQCPDLITVEERLARGSGIAVVRRSCERQPIATVYVLGVPDLHVERLPRGAVVLGKPFHSFELHQAVVQALRSLGSAAQSS